MLFRSSLFLAILVFSFTAAHADAPSVDNTSPVDVVKQMETDYGVHSGFRRNHAKGVCAIGEFTASAEAKSLSRSALFSGKSVPVIARFSDAGGVPTVPDTKKIPRGLALQFNLGDNGLHNMSMLNAPIFVVATPAAFLESLKAGTPEALNAFMEKYPESKPFFAWIGGNNPTASYVTAPYNSLNAFKFTNAANKDQFVRWQFVPDAGDVKLTDAELAKAKPDYLEDDLKARFKKGPATWTMVATLAEAGDSLTNPTVAWPSGRKTVKMGTLKLAKYENQIGGECNKINYDPTRVSDGVAISDDPILKFRSPAYAISYGKRLSDPPVNPPGKSSKAKNPAIAP